MRGKRSLAGLTAVMLLGSLIAGYGTTASAESTVHMDGNEYATIDSALEQAKVDMNKKMG